jgi:hypothetical protein
MEAARSILCNAAKVYRGPGRHKEDEDRSQPLRIPAWQGWNRLA